MDKSGWIVERFEDVFDLQMGKTPDRKNQSFFEGDNVWVSIKDLSSKYIDSSKEKISDDAIISSGIKQIKAGTVIMSFKLTVGKCAIASENLYTNEAIMAFCPKKEFEINNHFLYHYLSGYKWVGVNKAAMGLTLNKATISQQVTNIPPISKQLEISKELDNIENSIILIKDQLADLDRFSNSLFNDMFGDPVSNEKNWEVCPLKSLSSAIGNGNTPKGGSEVYVKEGILFLRSQNVWKNRIDLDDVAYIDEATHQSLKRSALRKNDLLITKTGRINTENSSLGRTALYTGEDGMANLNGHVYFVRLKEGIRHKFVLYILTSNSYRDLIRRTCVGGIDKRQLNKNHIEDFPIIMPPVEMQDKYIAIIEEIEKSKEELNKSLKDMETLLASRMQYYFE